MLQGKEEGSPVRGGPGVGIRAQCCRIRVLITWGVNHEVGRSRGGLSADASAGQERRLARRFLGQATIRKGLYPLSTVSPP